MPSNDGSKHVNNLLHTLRGEHFRRSQNLLKDRRRLPTVHNFNSPTLPEDVWSKLADVPDIVGTSPEGSRSVAGPIPKSWALKDTRDERDAHAWRADIISKVLLRLPSGPKIVDPSPPSFILLCLRLLLSSYPGPEFTEYVLPHLPPHLRRDLIRDRALHSPLSNLTLYALCEPEGHVDGELIVVGPEATLREDYFRNIKSGGSQRVHELDKNFNCEGSEPSSEEWDDTLETSIPLQTFILVSARISTQKLLNLPPTLTFLVLINLPTPVPLHRLPDLCPLLTTLDLSYNTWAQSSSFSVALDRVVWSRWKMMRTVVLRGSKPLLTTLAKINRGRWTDIEILQ